jgi:hypothetical protein
MTTTIRLYIFNLAGERGLLKTKAPATIADGDHLKLAGVLGQGQFTAIACKSLSTGMDKSIQNSRLRNGRDHCIRSGRRGLYDVFSLVHFHARICRFGAFLAEAGGFEDQEGHYLLDRLARGGSRLSPLYSGHVGALTI